MLECVYNHKERSTLLANCGMKSRLSLCNTSHLLKKFKYENDRVDMKSTLGLILVEVFGV